MTIERLSAPAVIGRMTLGPLGVVANARSNTATLTGTTTLDHTSALFQILDPGGASRNLVFHTEAQSTNVPHFVRNTADAAENLVCKAADGTTTFLTIGQNETGICYCDGTTWAGFAFPSGSGAGAYLLADGSVTGATSSAQPFTNGITAAPALAAAGDAVNIAETINHATASVEGIDLTVSAITTARTGGEVVGEKITLVGTATDTAGAAFVGLDLNATDTAGSGVFTGIKVDAGFDVLIDASEAATGEADVVVGDNLASAFQIREATNAIITVVTTDSSEKVQVSKTLDVDNALDLDHALTAAGDFANIAGTINHATADAEGLDASITQSTTARTSGTVVAVKAATTSLAGDTGGTYAGVQATHTDGGGTAKHVGLLVDGTSDAALATVSSTAGGAAAGTAAIVIESGDRTKNDADAGVPASGAVTIRSGDTDVTSAATAGVSGNVTIQTGNTDANNAGGTGGASGVLTLQSGDAASTLGTSGPSGNVVLESGTSADAATGSVTLQSGNAAAGNSGQVILQAGTAGGTQGSVQVAAGAAFDIDIPVDHDVALVAAGQAGKVDITINHASASAEALDVTATQLTTGRSSGQVAGILAGATSIAGDTGGVYSAVRAVSTDGGGTVRHIAFQVGSGHDDGLASSPSTAGGAAAATLDVNIRSGSRIKNDADAGVPTSGAITVLSGPTDVTGAAVGGASGAATFGSGATDSNNAGGTGGASGAVILGSGAANSTLGTSGATGNTTVQTGNSADAASGNVILQAGTAGTTQGVVQVAAGLSLDVNIPTDQDVALTAAGDALNVALTVNHATANVEVVDVSFAAITTARTGGTASLVKATPTGLAGDTAGASVHAFEAGAPVANGGSAVYSAIKVGAGYAAALDLSAAATGESDIVVKDNVADALTIREAANAYLTVVSTDNSEAIDVFKRATTTDGVASGDKRIVGGLANVRTAAGTSHTGSTDEAVLGSYSIPANTIKVGTVVTVKYLGRVTADNAGTTLTAYLRLGTTTLVGTALITTAAVDTSSGHIFSGQFELTGRAVPGAAAAVVGHGWFSDPGAAGGAMKNAVLNTTNFATNGALLLEVTGDWSAADANAVQLENFTVRIEG